MACQRSPPASPRAPKIQQQSWDDCGTPPIELFDPNRATPPSSPNLRFEHCDAPKSPKSPRKLPFCDQKSPSAKRKFDFAEQRSPKFEYVEQNFDDHPPKSPKTHRSYAKSPNGSFYEPRSPKYFDQNSSKSPKSPRHFVYDAISPKFENKNKKFEYYEPISPEDDHFKTVEGGKMVSKGYKNKNYDSRPFGIKSPGDASASDDSNYEKRNSVVTESTISGDSELSAATTAICSSGTSTSGGAILVGRRNENGTVNSPSAGNNSTVGGGGGSGDCSGGGGNNSMIGCASSGTRSNTEEEYRNRRANSRRRHAINITSNPGYQVLHSSHSTLDRTCSDSAVSRRCRKSTSDLTDVSEVNTSVTPAPKRRGSSKGGLAYLASRRGSRESIKSAASNASLFSNEDIGPLAFQASSRGRQRRTSNFLELPVPDHIRPRVCSLPERPYNPRQSDDLYRLRTFSISKGTVVNCGDSIISRRSRSNTSVNSTTSRASERSPFDGSCCGGGYAVVDSLPPSPTDSEPPPPPRYRVVMLGDADVGKTALVSQFMTSEYMHTYDASLDDEFGEKTVSILLDGEESEMIFIDHPTSEMSVENSLSTYEPHGCVVVYSVVARSSFRVAEEIVNYLWRENVTRDKAVILVGNKADLARSRVIPTAEGKSLAASRDAKFIETSSGIQHNVDELLVGILKQIRLKETRDKKAAICATKMRNSRTHMSLHLAKEILQKICLSDITKSKSCENLHVL